LSFERFIANRLKSTKGSNFSKPIISIATWGIALGICVMIVTLSIVKGFQVTVSDKVLNFNAPLSISKITSSDAYETPPIQSDYLFLNNNATIPYIKNIQAYANKAGVIKSGKDIHGVVLKGIAKNYDQSYLESCLNTGRVLNLDSNKREILISEKLASIAGKKVNDKIKLFFISQNKKTGSFQQRMYPFTIVGLYNSGLSDDFDKRFMICNIKYVQKLNYWDESMVGGYEVLLKSIHPSLSESSDFGFNRPLNATYLNDFSFIDFTKDELYNKHYEELSQLKVNTVMDRYPQIFDWLKLFDTHIITIIAIIVIISIINMIAVLFILLIEKTSFIGILKALGANSKSIQKIFLFQSAAIIIKGIIFGNILGIGLCLLQYFFHLIKLDQSVYYIKYVPIQINWLMVLFINIITLSACLISLLLPSKYISKVYPSKSIRFN
jgi:lipoprotein-releasing system permease protein